MLALLSMDKMRKVVWLVKFQIRTSNQGGVILFSCLFRCFCTIFSSLIVFMLLSERLLKILILIFDRKQGLSYDVKLSVFSKAQVCYCGYNKFENIFRLNFFCHIGYRSNCRFKKRR